MSTDKANIDPEVVAKLEAEFETARIKLRESSRAGDQQVEQRYGLAYQALVRIGRRMQIKKKYR